MLSEYIPLDALAVALGLPRTYLRNLAAGGQIPFLDVNGRRRFDEGEVRQRLRELAAQNKNHFLEASPCSA